MPEIGTVVCLEFNCKLVYFLNTLTRFTYLSGLRCMCLTPYPHTHRSYPKHSINGPKRTWTRYV